MPGDTLARCLFAGMGTFSGLQWSRRLLLGNISGLIAIGLLPASQRERWTNWKIYHQTLILHISPSLAGPSSFKSPFQTQLSGKNEKSFF